MSIQRRRKNTRLKDECYRIFLVVKIIKSLKWLSLHRQRPILCIYIHKHTHTHPIHEHHLSHKYFACWACVHLNAGMRYLSPILSTMKKKITNKNFKSNTQHRLQNKIQRARLLNRDSWKKKQKEKKVLFVLIWIKCVNIVLFFFCFHSSFVIVWNVVESIPVFNSNNASSFSVQFNIQ